MNSLKALRISGLVAAASISLGIASVWDIFSTERKMAVYQNPGATRALNKSLNELKECKKHLEYKDAQIQLIYYDDNAIIPFIPSTKNPDAAEAKNSINQILKIPYNLRLENDSKKRLSSIRDSLPKNYHGKNLAFEKQISEISEIYELLNNEKDELAPEYLIARRNMDLAALLLSSICGISACSAGLFQISQEQ